MEPFARSRHGNRIACSALSGLVLLSAWILPAGRVSAATGRVVEIVADKDNIFKVSGQKKPIITAKPGEMLTLKITSFAGPEVAKDGSEHSVVIKSLRDQGWDLRLKHGTQEFTLAAPKTPGEYLVECTVKCGRGHDDMQMKLIVRN